MKNTIYFTSSLILQGHPMKSVNYKTRMQYYIILKDFVEKFDNSEFISIRLKQYEKLLGIDYEKLKVTGTTINAAIRFILNSSVFQPWRKKYCYIFMCDIALILLDEDTVQKATAFVRKYVGADRKELFDKLLLALKDEQADISDVSFASRLIEQYWANRRFFQKKEVRYIVTANMSAGKSTLINALVGKVLARTSQEVCTGNIGYLYNKPFEDNHIHLKASQLNLDAAQEDLTSFEWDAAVYIASHFRTLSQPETRVCLIDTPGVNSAINRKHGRITKEALKNERYDKLIYVLNANKIGTDEEIRYLKWIAKNVPEDKVVFVLNKLDDFKNEDDVQASIEGIQKDLLQLGYKQTTICPLSAYCALLAKLKENGEMLTSDEAESYEFYKKKFSRPMYDFSKYYDDIQNNTNESEYLSISKKCGLYGLEKILFENQAGEL